MKLYLQLQKIKFLHMASFMLTRSRMNEKVTYLIDSAEKIFPGRILFSNNESEDISDDKITVFKSQIKRLSGQAETESHLVLDKTKKIDLEILEDELQNLLKLTAEKYPD